MASLAMFTSEELKRLRVGGIVTIGSKRYRLCYGCECVIKVNKPFIGSLHICDD